jgi:hypothetical protein
MPLDRFLPPENLKVDQIIARNYGHVRIESGVTKFYWPEVKAVFSWTTPEIFSNQEDFYSATVACQSDFGSSTSLTTYTDSGVAGSVSIASYWSQSGITGRQNKRVVINADINGDTTSDDFVVSAGYTKYIGFSVKTRQSGSYFSQAQAGSQRLMSKVVSLGIGINTALVLPRSSLTPFSPVATASFTTTYITNNPVGLGYNGGAPSTITFSVATISAGSFAVTVPFRSTAESANSPGILIPWSQSIGPDELVDDIYKVSVLSAGTTVVSGFLSVSNIVTVGSGGFAGTFSGIPTTGVYTVRVEEKRPAIYSSITASASSTNYDLFTAAVCCQGVSTVSVSSAINLSGLDTIFVTGEGAITGGGIASVSTVNISTIQTAMESDWTIQKLSINLRTRDVSGFLRFKPKDTTIIGVIFNDSYGYVVDPGITNLKFAARNVYNTSDYLIYKTDTTIVSVGGANYYKIQLIANDSDMLDKQNNSILAGSNQGQSLIGEIEWVTTLGTFSSNSFTIYSENKIVREPDV